MHRTHIRRGTTSATVLAVLLAVLMVTGLAPAGAQDTPTDTGDDALAAQVDAYLRAYPGLSVDQARAAAEGQSSRKELYEEASRNGGRDFGGAWFDPRSGELNIAVTNQGAARRVQDAGERRGLQVRAHQVRRPVRDLEAQAEEIRRGSSDLARAARGQVGFDVRTNTVVVAVPADQRAELEAQGVPDGVVLIDDPQLQTEADYACTSRTNCDLTLRAGTVLWRNPGVTNWCSLGFTARDSSNRRYVLTAGHCSTGNGVNWGTGGTQIGPMYASIDSGAYDAAIIRNFSSYFAGHPGGEIYINANSYKVNYAAPNLSYIWQGDTVCLAANYTNPGATGSRCGVVGTNSDPAVRGMARVDGIDACGGDSGGGWYWLANNSYRVAYGLHSRSDVGCNGSQGGDTSWFSPVPTVINNWAPWLRIETS